MDGEGGIKLYRFNLMRVSAVVQSAIKQIIMYADHNQNSRNKIKSSSVKKFAKKKNRPYTYKTNWFLGDF